jgi:rhomboid protease GluP
VGIDNWELGVSKGYHRGVFLRRQREGSVICTSCGVLVGVNDDKCYNCGRRNPGLWGFAPALRALGGDLGFVPFVIGACVVLFILALALNPQGVGMRGIFGFGAPSIQTNFLLGASGRVPVLGAGRWWTVLSAGWLHGSILHILFNMMAVRQLAPAIAELYGPGRMIIIYTAGSVVGFVLSSIAPPFPFIGGSQYTVGASAAIAGLIGALLAYGHRTGSSMATAQATQNIVMLAVYGFMLGGIINNLAHGGGVLGGYLAAKWLDPMKPERIDHVVIALACLGASLLAIVASFVHGQQFLR